MASDGNKKQALIWAVYPDGLHIFSEGRVVGVIPFDEANHLIAELSNSIRWIYGKGAQKKDPAKQGQV
tara:strand:- start:726 stop:929 length:204 start_codon:yes stop_codon:yes gene_type:complete